MLVKGVKIKLVKQIPNFNTFNVGQIFEITDVSDNKIISIKCNLGNGILSYDTFEQYFELTKETKVKHEWTKWMVFHQNGKAYYYKTNQKDIIIKRDDKKVRCQCHPNDEFSLGKGLRLGVARIECKIATENLLEITKEM